MSKLFVALIIFFEFTFISQAFIMFLSETFILESFFKLASDKETVKFLTKILLGQLSISLGILVSFTSVNKKFSGYITIFILNVSSLLLLFLPLLDYSYLFFQFFLAPLNTAQSIKIDFYKVPYILGYFFLTLVPIGLIVFSFIKIKLLSESLHYYKSLVSEEFFTEIMEHKQNEGINLFQELEKKDQTTILNNLSEVGPYALETVPFLLENLVNSRGRIDIHVYDALESIINKKW